MTIVSVVGARPQFVKAALVSDALSALRGAREIVVHTGQHYDRGMSDVFFDELNMRPPACNLEVGSGSHAVQTAEIMKRLEPVLLKASPDLVLIYGDTNSTLAAAVTAVKLHIPVAHVEAGLRSFNPRMPEEINRIVADRLAALLFAPTRAAVSNLRREGRVRGVWKTGDVMYDAARKFAGLARERCGMLSALNVASGAYILATVHRSENTGAPARLAAIFRALREVSRTCPVLLPLHPRTRKMLETFGLTGGGEGVRILDPVGFLDMICLESHARLIVTDSGGVQKEAYFHRVPCVTLRDETEWIETVQAGWNRLAAVDSPRRLATMLRLALDAPKPHRLITEYGDGHAAGKIAEVIGKWLSQ